MRSPSKPIKLLVAVVAAVAGLVASGSAAGAQPAPRDTASATVPAHHWHCGYLGSEYICWPS